MYLSLNWLKEYVNIPKTVAPQELANKMTMHTVEVDAVLDQAEKYKHIVIGKILEVGKHPNADRLQIAKVDISESILEIVCGAPNIEPGQLVPVALIGAVLPNGLEIKEAEVRGVRSSGMLCAQDEVGLGDDHSGIMILGKKAKVGQRLADYLEIKDVVIEVDNKSITHRADLWSHFGMAREVAAFLGTKFSAKAQELANLGLEQLEISELPEIELSVSVHDHKLCPRYMAVAISGIKIEPSPAWMQERLIAVGMRPINNIVDITNYVMLELGQPLHAFDFRKIKTDNPEKKQVKINVRLAAKGEAIETLDGQKRPLEEEMLVIADERNPIAVAGVMGGAKSEISPDTGAIILESADFDFISIRKTSQKLGLRTESSIRYEKCLDPNTCQQALIRAVKLICELNPGAKLSSAVADKKNFSLNQQPLSLSYDWIEKRIGMKLEKKWIKDALSRLGFQLEDKSGVLTVIAPTWRAAKDIERPEDIIEEIARLYGYDNIRKEMPSIKMRTTTKNDQLNLKHKLRNLLSAGCGLSECYNYSFASEDYLSKMQIDHSNYLRLANPISAQLTLLRQSLVPNLLLNVAKNQARAIFLGFFEVGYVYFPTPGNLPIDNQNSGYLPYQEERLAIVLAGDQEQLELFGQAKSIITFIFQQFGQEVKFLEPQNFPNWSHPKLSAAVSLNGREAGRITCIDSKIAKSIGVKKETVAAELLLSELTVAAQSYKLKLAEFEKFPPAIRDIAFVIDKKIMYNDIKEEITNFSPYIKHVELFDVYEGDKLGIKKKSLAFHIIYHADKTLTSEEVDEMQKALIGKMNEKFEAQVRDF